MTFVATPVQVQLIDEIRGGESSIIGFGGGIRGTKTYGVIAAVLLLAKMYPGSRWCFVRKDLQRLRDTTIPSLEKFVREMGMERFVGEMNESRWERECSNGSVLLFRGENRDKDPDLNRFDGYEVNGFANEEANELSERTIAKEIQRAGGWIIPGRGVEDQPRPFIFNTFNPCANWPRRMFYVPWRDQTIQKPYAFIPTTAADNPFIPEATRLNWKEMPANEYRRFVEGDWESMSGAYYDAVTQKTLIDRKELPVPIPAHWRFWGSYDWGYRHHAVFGAWVTDEDGVDYLLDSIWMRREQDTEMALTITRDTDPRHLREVYAGHDCWNKVVAHGASGITTADVFAEHRIMLIKADIDKVNGGRAVNRQAKDGSFRIVRTVTNLKGFDQLQDIVPDENDVRKPEKVDADDEGVGGDDFADMTRYGIASRVANAKRPKANQDGKQPDRAMSLVVKDGKVVRPPKPVRTIEDLAAQGDGRRTRVEHKERLPRRAYR